VSGTSRVTDRVRESQRVTDRGRKVMDTHEEGAGGEAKMRESQRVTDRERKVTDRTEKVTDRE